MSESIAEYLPRPTERVVTPEILMALQAFAERHGKNWRNVLTMKIMEGKELYEPHGWYLNEIGHRGLCEWIWDSCTIEPRG